MTRLYQVVAENFRCHKTLEVESLGADWVVLGGGNGSGKTSILEAIYSAARGRSFRSAALNEVIRHGTDVARVLLRGESDRPHILGMEIQNRRRLAHLDSSATDLMEIARALPVEYLGGDSIRLVQASPAVRRRYMDWTLFHVEPGFLPAWRQWYRAHRQRNALLKSRASERALGPWTEAVATHGEAVTQFRAGLIKKLRFALERAPCALLPELNIGFRPGWRGVDLRTALAENAPRETQVGRAVVGPQLDDWSLDAETGSAATLSRGQAKLSSVLLYRCQARLMEEAGRKPLYLMDDIAADLDKEALDTALGLWENAGLQLWLTMLEEDIGRPLKGRILRFHVEHGAVIQG